MIAGTVNEDYEATIRLTVRGDDREEREIEAIIDTGFTGQLTLPMPLIDRLGLSWKGRSQALIADGSIHIFDEYIGTVLWNGEVRTVEVAAAETDPLVGMGLLRGHSLRVDIVENGAVMIESLTL